ncbi:MAG: FlgO family outer membrane protein [Desulfuromonadaceae bacterium]|nr:FlgO family outer membrane protein [Desulfuromonadaceae bacterium]
MSCKLFTSFLLAITVVVIAGCANSAKYPYNGASQVAKLNSDQRYIIDESLNIQQSQTSVGRFNAQMIFMADQIERNADRKSLDNTFIVTSFSNLNKLSETNAFGRLVAENMIHELQVRKWRVFEVRLTKDVVINEAGEFTLSRDIQKIRESYKVGGIVTGTYSVSGNHIIVNARVVDINNGLVASSGQIHMPVNWFTDSLLFNTDSLKSMKIVGDTPLNCKENPVCWGGDLHKQGVLR